MSLICRADTIIVATGQRSGPFGGPGKKDDAGVLDIDKSNFRSSVPKLYAVGDYITGPSTVIEAIAMGRKSAHQITEDLTGSRKYKAVVRMEDVRTTDRERKLGLSAPPGDADHYAGRRADC